MENETLYPGCVVVGDKRNDFLRAVDTLHGGGEIILPHRDKAGFLIDEPPHFPEGWSGTVRAASSTAAIAYDGTRSVDVLFLLRGKHIVFQNVAIRKHPTRGGHPAVMLLTTRCRDGDSEGRSIFLNCEVAGGYIAAGMGLADEQQTAIGCRWIGADGHGFLTDSHNRYGLRDNNMTLLADAIAAGTVVDEAELKRQSRFTNTHRGHFGCSYVADNQVASGLVVSGHTVGFHSTAAFFSGKGQAFVRFEGHETSGRRGGVPTDCRVDMTYAENGAEHAVLCKSSRADRMSAKGCVVTGLPSLARSEGKPYYRIGVGTPEYGAVDGCSFQRAKD